MRKSITKPEAKQRRANDTVVTIAAKIGTRTEYCLGCLKNVVDDLDKNDMKGHHIIMNNAPIHKLTTIRNYFEEKRI